MIGAALFVTWNALVLWLWMGSYGPHPSAMAASLAAAWRDGEFSAGLLARNWAGFAAAAILAAGVLGAASAAGERACGWLGRRGAVCRGLVGLVLGLGLAGSATLGLGFSGLLFAPPGWVAWVVLVPFAVFGLRRMAASAGRWRAEWPPLSPVSLACLAAAAVVVLGGLLSVETGWDALMYHLRLPSFYAYRHKVWHVWHSYYGAYPAQVEMLYVVGRLLPGGAGDLVARMLHAAFGGILCLAAAGFARELGGSGRLAAVLVAACPLVLALVSRAYVDLGVAAFGSLALLEWVRGARTGSRPAFVTGAALAGFAMAGKYAGVLVVPAMLAVALPVRGARVAAVAAATLPVLPWLLKNAVWIGNPVAPFLGGIFGSAGSLPADVTPWFEQQHAVAGLVRSLPIRVLSLLLEPGHLRSPLAPAIAGLLPLVCLPEGDASRRRVRRGALAYVGGWMLLAPEARFVLPALPGLAALIAVRLAAAASWPVARRAGLRVALEASLVAAAACAVQVAVTSEDPAGMALGRRSARGLLAAGLPPAPYRAYANEVVNARVSTADRVLVVSHFSTYYIDRECLADYHTGRTRLAVILAEGRNAQGIARRLRQLGIRWLLFTAPGVADFAKVPGAWEVPPGAWEGFAGCLRERGDTIWQTDWFALIRFGAPHAPRPLPVLPAYETLAFAEADRLFGAGDALAALARYRAAPPLLADVGSTALRVAVACMALGRWSEAYSSLRRARSLGVEAPGLHAALVHACIQQGRADEALAEADAARRKDPLSPAAAMERARALSALGRVDEALRAADAARRLRPEGAVLLELGRVADGR
ncbi:MAG: glycosyltransferase family 39 protein [Candidatus Coatesbacteria bacterium]